MTNHFLTSCSFTDKMIRIILMLPREFKLDLFYSATSTIPLLRKAPKYRDPEEINANHSQFQSSQNHACSGNNKKMNVANTYTIHLTCYIVRSTFVMNLSLPLDNLRFLYHITNIDNNQLSWPMTNLLEKIDPSTIPFSETQAKLQVPNSLVYTYIFLLHTPTYYLYFNKKN